MATVTVKNLSKKYGTVTALAGLDLDIPDGALVSLLGPSGCGKTTVLRLIAGFEKPDSGDIFVGGVRMNDTPVNRRNIGMVFQSYALFPHLTVWENIAYGLQQNKLPKREIEQRTAEAIDLVQLIGCGPRKPKQLSGGQQQRVALARALVTRPKILLLDECLSALDKKLRVEMQAELRRILEASHITALFVTHDQEEALTLSDFVAVMNEGKVVQMGNPTEVYEKPQNRFVAGFLGKVNFIEAEAAGLGKGAFLVRPEKIKIHECPPNKPHLVGTVEYVTYAGNITTYTFNCGGKQVLAEDQAVLPAKYKQGAKGFLSWEKEHCLPMED
ncbi:MAG: ABC transporter ATP-binding protein [Clostridiales bacterium]|nr:ABC transporter ATP-binding protein [Clostridiales bacterium]